MAARHLSDDFLTEYYKLNPKLDAPVHPNIGQTINPNIDKNPPRMTL